MCRLICTVVVRIWHKTRFCMTWPILLIKFGTSHLMRNRNFVFLLQFFSTTRDPTYSNYILLNGSTKKGHTGSRWEAAYVRMTLKHFIWYCMVKYIYIYIFFFFFANRLRMRSFSHFVQECALPTIFLMDLPVCDNCCCRKYTDLNGKYVLTCFLRI